MASASDYLEDAIGRHVLMNTPYTSPTTVYLALYTAAPTDTGGGTEVVNSGTSAYVRQAITFTESGTTNGQFLDNAVEVLNMLDHRRRRHPRRGHGGQPALPRLLCGCLRGRGRDLLRGHRGHHDRAHLILRGDVKEG